jgi:hypothetical protein
MVRYGAVIVFTEGIDKEHAEYLLNQMVRDGRIEDPGRLPHAEEGVSREWLARGS